MIHVVPALLLCCGFLTIGYAIARRERPQIKQGEPFLLDNVEVVIIHVDRDPYGALAFTGMDAATYANNNRWRNQ